MSIPNSTYNKVLKRDEYICQRCYSNQNLTLHHMCHRENGGTDRQDNLIVLCFFCHRDWHALYDRRPESRLSRYLKPLNEVDSLFIERERNKTDNAYRNYSICNENERYVRNKRKTKKGKGKRSIRHK